MLARARAVCLACAVVVAFSGGQRTQVAGAAVLALPAGPYTAGPVLAGDEVVWAVHEADGAEVLMAAGPGGVRELRRSKPDGNGPGPVRLAASASVVVAGLTSFYPDGPHSALRIESLVAIAPDGSSTGLGSYVGTRSGFDVDASSVLFGRCEGGTASPRMVVRDLESGTERDLGPGSDGRLAGPYAAVHAPEVGLRVLDLRDPSVARTIAGRDLPGELRAFDVGADGRVVLVYATGAAGPQRLAVVEPGDVVPRPIAYPPAYRLLARWSGDRLLVLRGTRRSSRATIEEVGTDGGRQVLHRDADAGAGDGAFDVDAGRRATLRSTCRGLEVVVSEAFEPVPVQGRCALALRGVPRLDRFGWVRGRVDCSSYVLGACEGGRVELRMLGGSGRVVASGRLQEGATFRIRLDRRTLSRLHRRRFVLHATVTDASSRRISGRRIVVLRRGDR